MTKEVVMVACWRRLRLAPARGYWLSPAGPSP